MQRGQEEATRLTTARLGNANHVTSLDGNGPRLYSFFSVHRKRINISGCVGKETIERRISNTMLMKTKYKIKWQKSRVKEHIVSHIHV